MDVIFDCPACNQELAVDAEAAGNEIACPTCGEVLTIPTPEDAKSTSESSPSSASAGESKATPKPVSFKVPQHQESAESLIEKPNKPLEAAAKEQGFNIRVKTIRHSDCMEVGKDHYDARVTEFLQKVGRDNIISINAINYTHLDMSTQREVTDYGLTIIYVG